STTGRRRSSDADEEGAPEDATLENVAQATRELDNIVDGIIRKGHKVSKAKLKKQSRRGEETELRARDNERGRNEDEEEDRQVVRLRFSGSSTVEDGQVAYVYMKRKAVFLPHMDEVRLVSDPQKHNEPLLKVQVSRSDDPEWTHMTILMMDRDKRLLAVVDLECRGDEARAVRINGIPVAPIW
ncbi:hypothetical protein PRIPAC_91316, partial [Pristionchus pacificus]